MALPEAIRKQVEETDARYGEDGELKSPDESGESLNKPSENLEESGETAPITDDNKPTDETTDVDDSLSTSTSPATTDEVQPKQQLEQELQLANQRYSSLQGMYNSTIGQLREATAQIEELRQAIATLQAPPAATNGATRPSGSQQGVTDEEVEEYSKPYFDMMDRYVAAKLAPIEAQLQGINQVPEAFGALNNRLETVAKSQKEIAEDRFFEGLSQAHPDWEAINNAPTFTKWLQVVEPLSGISRKVYLDDARNRLDLGLVSNTFAQFKADTGYTGKAVPNKSQKKEELLKEAVVNPRKGQSSIPADSTKKSYTKADLDKLYADRIRGKYKGKEGEEKFVALERQLVQAIAEGRYTQ